MPRPIERLPVQREHGDALAQADGEEDPPDGVAWTLPGEEGADAREGHANEGAGGLLAQADVRHMPIGVDEHQPCDRERDRRESDGHANARSGPLAHTAASGSGVNLLISPTGVSSSRFCPLRAARGRVGPRVPAEAAITIPRGASTPLRVPEASPNSGGAPLVGGTAGMGYKHPCRRPYPDAQPSGA